MTEKIVRYKATCDGCGCIFSDEYNNRDAFRKDIKKRGWIDIGGGRIACPICKNKKEGIK